MSFSPRFLLVLFFFVVFAYAGAQENAPIAVPKEPLPTGYNTILLGMTREQVMEELKKTPAFGYRGERDVSLLPEPNQMIIETPGGVHSFFGPSWFQFYNNKLYILTINFNKEKTDYFSIFSALLKKYGEPTSLSPEKTVWQNDSVIMSLERPLTLKYVDAPTFKQLSEAASVKATADETLHQEFLDRL